MPRRVQPAIDDQEPKDASAFVKTSWTGAIERRFEDWQSSISEDVLLGDMVTPAITEGLALSVRMYDESFVASLRDKGRELAGKPSVLSGWSDSPIDALYVLFFKHLELCTGSNWDTFEVEAKGRRR